MLTAEMQAILEAAEATGWILEPDAKRLLFLAGMTVPNYIVAQTSAEAVAAAEQIGYPVVAKVVSPAIVHKSDVGGVIVGIQNTEQLKQVFDKVSVLQGFSGLLVEEMLPGVELIVGATMDYQFGPVILLGIGGTGVEIYQDTVIRMAPITGRDIHEMLTCLKGQDLIKGHRGAEPVDIPELTRQMLSFSELVMDLGDHMTSIDLNPVKCTGNRCVVADARIMLT